MGRHTPAACVLPGRMRTYLQGLEEEGILDLDEIAAISFALLYCGVRIPRISGQTVDQVLEMVRVHGLDKIRGTVFDTLLQGKNRLLQANSGLRSWTKSQGLSLERRTLLVSYLSVLQEMVLHERRT